MAKKPIVGSMSEWSGVLKDLFRQIDDGSISLLQIQAFLEHQDPFAKPNVQDWLQQWQAIYQKYFSLDCDFSQVKIPERQIGFNRLIVVIQGLTLNQVYDACAKHFPCQSYTDDLDKAVTHNDRNPSNGSYAIWVRDRVEADEELKNLSADQLKEQGIQGITLLERVLYELKYWDETKQHLDKQNWTLCSGSRDSDGRVPYADWLGSAFRVDWDHSDDHCDSLRARAAVL